MKRIGLIGQAALVTLLAGFSVGGQDKSATGENGPLILTSQIPLPGVHGRFDHFTFNPSEPARVFISALGNNSVEVIDIFLAVLYSPNKDAAVWVYTVQE